MKANFVRTTRNGTKSSWSASPKGKFRISFLFGVALEYFFFLFSQLPPELRQQGGNMVQVNMEDHRHEDFKPSASKAKPFAGKGHTLGRFVNDCMPIAHIKS